MGFADRFDPSCSTPRAEHEYSAVFDPVEVTVRRHLGEAQRHVRALLPHIAALQAGQVGAPDGYDWDVDELLAILAMPRADRALETAMAAADAGADWITGDMDTAAAEMARELDAMRQGDEGGEA